LFVNSPDAAAKLQHLGTLRLVLFAMLTGVAIQIAIAVVYKTTNSRNYVQEVSGAEGNKYLDGVFDWLTSSWLLELTVDAVTVGLYVWATWLIVEGLAPAQQ
jgi:hypothetical protein